MRIRTRHVADQAAMGRWLALMEQRQVAYLRLAGAGGDQRGERMLVEEPRNRRLIIARKRRRPVQAHRSGNV
jgi:hypothetical protein